jgi:hypothetical protein
MTTVDNEAELYKIKDHWPTAGVVIKLQVREVHQPRCPFFINRCMNISKTKNFNQEEITLSIKKRPPIHPLLKPQVQNARYSYVSNEHFEGLY